LASSNNINSSGFSMNEIFDSMGGGRNNSIYTTSSGAFSINGMRFGGGNGITQSNMLGINYADEWVDNLESNMSYFYTSADTENNNKSKRVTFLTENDGDTSGTENSLITESSSTSDTDRYAHNFNTQFEFEIDSTSTIYFDPKFVKANSKGKNTSLQSTRDQDDILLNNSDNSSFSNNDNTSFSSSFDYSKSFIKKGRYINFYFENENRLDDGTTSNKSTTNFYDSDNNSTTIDERDQVNYNRQIVDRYEFMAEYSEPITDSLNILATLNYRTNRSTENRNSFDFNETTNEYTELNDLLTNYSTSRTHGFNPEIGFEINKDKYSLNLSSGIRFLKFDNNGTYRGDNYAVNKNYTLPSGWANFSYKFSKSKSTYLHYSYSVDFPQARQVLDIEDISNPLHTMSGNPDLDPNKSHYFYVTFRDFDYATRSGYNFFGGGNIYDSRVVSTTLIDESAKRTTTYTNVSGTYNTWFGGYWNKSVKTENHKYRFNLGFSAGFDLNKGYTNGELYEAKGMRLSPRFNFTWEYGDLLTINPSYNFTYRETDYTNYTIESTSFTTHQFNLRTTSYWPKHVVFGNDFGYNYNSNLGDGFKRDFFLWNTSVGYNFLNDKLLFKVKVYDVLNQNLGTSRNVTATSILDQQNTVLKRYMMFSLTYKIEKFGGKKKEDKGNRFWWF
uniref:outer membrane beta-barrel protein n=1 Tax=uncultured Flavobacterium sp. TaxID=165435 RepID=UPI0025D110D3